MKLFGRKGQAEVMDGLILMLIAATCSVVLLSISSNYGNLPKQIYEETYAEKLAQNSLLSLYHITVTDPIQDSQFYRKSVMVAVSQDLSNGDISLPHGKLLVEKILKEYASSIGWQFVFAVLPDGVNMDSESIISTDSRVTDAASFKSNVGHPSCASSALTYPNSGTCEFGGEAGNMCYVIFEVCVWLP